MIMVVFIKKNDNSNKNITTNENFKNISYSDFNTIINKNNAIIYFTSENCTYCEELNKTLEKILNEIDITIYSLDVSKLSNSEKNEIETKYNSATPHLLAFKNGNLVDEIIGASDTYDTYYNFIKNNK